jgi:hypothetical protein
VSALVALTAGILALVVGTAFGWDSRLVDAIVSPPALVRAALVAASVLLGGWLLLRAVVRIGGTQPEAAHSDRAPSSGARDLGGLVRAVRLVFLAVAAFVAAGGWMLGSALPLIVALVIAGVDVVETSFLLIVVGPRRDA